MCRTFALPYVSFLIIIFKGLILNTPAYGQDIEIESVGTDINIDNDKIVVIKISGDPNDVSEILFNPDIHASDSYDNIQTDFSIFLDNKFIIELNDLQYLYNDEIKTLSFFLRDIEADPTKIHTAILLDDDEYQITPAGNDEWDITLHWQNYGITSAPVVMPPPAELIDFFDRVEFNVYKSSMGDCEYPAVVTSTAFEGTLEEISFEPTVHTFESVGLTSGTYCFQIRYVKNPDNPDNIIIAGSNIIKNVDLTAEYPDIQLQAAHVDQDNEQMFIYAETDDNFIDNYIYELYRGKDPNGLIEVLSKTGSDLDASDLYFTDDPDLTEGPWYYQIRATNPEDDVISTSGTLPSIFLSNLNTSLEEDAFEVTFERNHDANWEYSNFKVMRNGSQVRLLQATDTDIGYSEPLHMADITTAQIVYWLETEINDRTIESNQLKLFVDDIFDAILKSTPKAFRPERGRPGNRYFNIPFPKETEFDDYYMRIYDRHGLMLYQDDEWEHLKGWDGKINGQYAPSGPYIYEVYFKLGSYERAPEPGVINLVR